MGRVEAAVREIVNENPKGDWDVKRAKLLSAGRRFGIPQGRI